MAEELRWCWCRVGLGEAVGRGAGSPGFQWWCWCRVRLASCVRASLGNGSRRRRLPDGVRVRPISGSRRRRLARLRSASALSVRAEGPTGLRGACGLGTGAGRRANFLATFRRSVARNLPPDRAATGKGLTLA